MPNFYRRTKAKERTTNTGFKKQFNAGDRKGFYANRTDDRGRDHCCSGSHRGSPVPELHGPGAGYRGSNLGEFGQDRDRQFQDNNGTWPTNNSDAGIEEPADITGTYVSSVTVNSNEIAIVFNSGVHSGNTITLTAADQGGSISWVCEATVIPGSQLPSNCYGSDETAP